MQGIRHFWGSVCLLVMLAVSGCAQVPDQNAGAKKDNRLLVYPAPPDEARFYYERTIYGSANVMDRKQESGLKQWVTGETEAASNEPLAKPYAVAVHRGRVFVSDTADRVIKVFDVPQGRYFKIGEDDSGRLGKPIGIDLDGAGNLYVADASAKAIMVYDRDGKFLRRLGKPTMFDRLTSVTVDSKGDRVYVVDIGGVRSENHRVRVMDARTGELLFDIGKRGNGPGEFNLPRDVAIGKDGQLYVVDGGNFRIQVFDANGKFLNDFGKVGINLGNFARPKEAATDKDGNLYVIDAGFGNVQIFNAEGQLLLFLGDRSGKDGPGFFILPSGVYVDEDGRIYMVDQGFRKVDVFRPAALPAGTGYLVRKAPEGAAPATR